jgi:RNA polymerase sigma factor (sigma-70 family)
MRRKQILGREPRDSSDASTLSPAYFPNSRIPLMRRRKEAGSVSMSDAQLIGAARKGDETAWEQIVARYQSLINAISRRYRMSPSDAHDVSQHVWMQLVDHVDKLRDPRALPGWIAVTTTHRCYEISRAHQRSVTVDPLATGSFDLVDTAAKRANSDGRFDIDHDLLRAEQCSAVRQGLAELTETQRQLLLLLVADPPVPYREIGRRMNLPTGSIGPTRARLLMKLRRTGAVRRLVEDPPSAVSAEQFPVLLGR